MRRLNKISEAMTKKSSIDMVQEQISEINIRIEREVEELATRDDVQEAVYTLDEKIQELGDQFGVEIKEYQESLNDKFDLIDSKIDELALAHDIEEKFFKLEERLKDFLEETVFIEHEKNINKEMDT